MHMSAPNGGTARQAGISKTAWQWVVCSWFVVYFSSEVFIFPFVNVYLQTQGFSGREIGLIGAVRPWFAVPASFLWGAAADYFQVHTTLMVVLILSSNALRLLLPLSNAFVPVFAILVLSSSLSSPVTVMADAAVTRSCTVEGEYGWYRLWGAVGWGGMSTVAGAVLDAYGIWTALWIGALLSLPAAWLSLYLWRTNDAVEAGTAGDSDASEAPRSGLHRDLSAKQFEDLGGDSTLEMVVRPAPDCGGCSEYGLLAHRKGSSTDWPSDWGTGGPKAGPPTAQHAQERDPVAGGSAAAAAAATHAHAHAHGAAHARVHSGGSAQGAAAGLSFFQKLATIFSRAESLHFFFTVTVMGVGFGIIECFLFLLLNDMGAPDALLGLTLTVTCIAEVPVFRLLTWMMAKLGGPDALLDVCLATYILRMLLYSLLPHFGSPWWVLPIEVLHGFTFGAGWGAGCEKSKALAPPGLEATQQGVFQGVYFGLGYGLGSLIGGLISEAYGYAFMYMVVCCQAEAQETSGRVADEDYMQEYTALKDEIMTNTRRAGATLGVYLLLTAGGECALCGLLGMSVGTLYLQLLFRDVDGVKGTDSTPMLAAKNIENPVQRYLAIWLCSYYYSLRPRLLVPVGFAALFAAYQSLADAPLTNLNELSLTLGFLSYKAALFAKLVGEISVKPYSEVAYKPSIPRIEDDEGLALDRWGRPMKPQFTMPTAALPDDVDPDNMGLLPTLLAKEVAKSMDDDLDSPPPKRGLPSTSAAGNRRGELQRCRHKLHDFSLWRDELPTPPAFVQQGAVAGTRTRATPLLSPQRVLDRLYASVHPAATQHFGAFYSSELGGIVTHPAFMAIHVDDHMVHRGHGVVGCVPLHKGALHQLPQHLQNFKRSAFMAGISPPMSDAAMASVIKDTATASKKSDGNVRFWVSPGRGGMGLSSMECVEATFYVMVTSEPSELAAYRDSGVAAHASSVPPLPAPLGGLGSTDRMQAGMAAGDGSNVGVFVDGSGHVLEAANGNIGVLTAAGVLVTPPLDNTANWASMQRLLQLVQGEGRSLPGGIKVKAVEERPVHADELASAKEAFLVAGCTVVSLVSWGGSAIGGGKPGPAAKAFTAVLEGDLAA
ncbi:hypothetical protein FOA52_012265 [Chlamydomonas sp. UWO 241]|nr:hypothetical protein FOA52_012265 [Chlamydomonas sp. UWO 241]